LVLIVVTGNLKSILDRIVGVTTALVVVVMLVEYLILKGRTRSAILPPPRAGGRPAQAPAMTCCPRATWKPNWKDLRERMTTASRAKRTRGPARGHRDLPGGISLALLGRFARADLSRRLNLILIPRARHFIEFHRRLCCNDAMNDPKKQEHLLGFRTSLRPPASFSRRGALGAESHE